MNNNMVKLECQRHDIITRDAYSLSRAKVREFSKSRCDVISDVMIMRTIFQGQLLYDPYISDVNFTLY